MRRRHNSINGHDAITAAFRNEWTDNPDDEITKQVIGYFQDDREDYTATTTTRRPVVYREEPLPPPQPLSPMSRSSSFQPNQNPPSNHAKEMKLPNNYHPFSGFYYKNKFNSA